MFKGKRIKKLSHEKISEILIKRNYSGVECYLYGIVGEVYSSRRKSYSIFSISYSGLELSHISSWDSPYIGVDIISPSVSRYKKCLVQDRDDFL